MTSVKKYVAPVSRQRMYVGMEGAYRAQRDHTSGVGYGRSNPPEAGETCRAGEPVTDRVLVFTRTAPLPRFLVDGTVVVVRVTVMEGKVPVRFEDLPFHARPDLTPFLVHLTRNTDDVDGFSALDNLESILRTGRVSGSGRAGFVKGATRAACFMDVPFASLKYVLNPTDASSKSPRYEPYGIFVTKTYAYKAGCRPVMYLSNDEVTSLRIPKAELWRVVRLEVSEAGWVSWLHEREWRCRGDFQLPGKLVGVLVRKSAEAEQLAAEIRDKPHDYKSKPRCILPLQVVCQGLKA